jgi:hypothetical protein
MVNGRRIGRDFAPSSALSRGLRRAILPICRPEQGEMHMGIDTGAIYELALGEGDQYAAIFAAILNAADAACEARAFEADDFVIEEPDF